MLRSVLRNGLAHERRGRGPPRARQCLQPPIVVGSQIDGRLLLVHTLPYMVARTPLIAACGTLVLPGELNMARFAPRGYLYGTDGGADRVT